MKLPYRSILCSGLLLLVLLISSAALQGQTPPAGMLVGAAPGIALPYTLDCLANMSWCELEQIYRQARPGQLPHGFLTGKAIFDPCRRCAKISTRVSRVIWKGKHFNACECSVINQWAGCRMIRGNVYYDMSWLDGQPSIILDYRDTSRLWRHVRDEMREIAPGLYVGLMYQEQHHGCPRVRTFFAIQMQPYCCPLL